ncbi:hypothetical protein ABPG72_013408 [Tetrahymena utriculariae]
MMQDGSKEKIKYIDIQYKLQLSDILNFKRGQEPVYEESFLEEVNSFYLDWFENIEKKLQQYDLLQDLNIDPNKINHNTCVLIGPSNTWNFSLFFANNEYENRNKAVELKDFRYCQAGLLKKSTKQQTNFKNFELRLVKKIDRNHPKSVTKYGEFLLCHFISRDQLKSCSKHFKLYQKTEQIQNKTANQLLVNEYQPSLQINQISGLKQQLENNSNNSSSKLSVQKEKIEYEQITHQNEKQKLPVQTYFKQEKDFVCNDLQRQQQDFNELHQIEQTSSTINLQDQDQETFQSNQINLYTIKQQQNTMQFNNQSSSIQEKQAIYEVPQHTIYQFEHNQQLFINQEKPQSNNCQNNQTNQSNRTSSKDTNFFCKSEHDQQPNSQKERYIQFLEKKVQDLEYQLNKEILNSARERMKMFYYKNPDYEPYKKQQKENIKQETIEID